MMVSCEKLLSEQIATRVIITPQHIAVQILNNRILIIDFACVCIVHLEWLATDDG